jgi:hypothetical protein
MPGESLSHLPNSALLQKRAHEVIGYNRHQINEEVFVADYGKAQSW